MQLERVRLHAQAGVVTGELSSWLHSGDSAAPATDMELVAGDGSVLPCHAAVLAIASPVLGRALVGIKHRDQEPVARVVMSEVSRRELRWLLEFVYTGQCQVEPTLFNQFSSLLVTLRIKNSGTGGSNDIKTMVKEEQVEHENSYDDFSYLDDYQEEQEQEMDYSKYDPIDHCEVKMCDVMVENMDLSNFSPPPVRKRKPRYKTDSEDDDFIPKQIKVRKKETEKRKVRKKETGQRKKYTKTGKYAKKIKTESKTYSSEELEELKASWEERERNEVRHNNPFENFNRNKKGDTKQCQFCSFKTLSIKTLEEHIESNHSDQRENFENYLKTKEKYKCIYCDAFYMKFKSVEEHISEFHQDKMDEFEKLRSYKCLMCPMLFFTLLTRANHEGTCHGIDSTKLFGKKNWSRIWLKRKKGKRTCEECGKSFKENSNFEDHMLMHSTGVKKPFSCETCGASFSYRTYMKKHQMTCTPGEVLCTDCGSTFSCEIDMKRHRMFGTCIQDLSCLPKRVFKRGKERGTHVKSEDSEELFICDKCAKQFVKKGSYTQHIKLCNMKDEDMFCCDHCDQKFNTKARMERHTKQHFEPTKQCPHCPKKFHNDYYLQRHMRSHLSDAEKPFNCIDCGKGFLSEKQLEEHMNIHTGLKPHQCSFCDARFSNSSNKRAHEMKRHGVEKKRKNVPRNYPIYNFSSSVSTEQKPYPCRYCPMSYSNSSNRNAHEKKRHLNPDQEMNINIGPAPVGSEDDSAIANIMKERWQVIHGDTVAQKFV